ncbi:hypothetical protein B0H14DRAFT_3866367 [Mycena olivaceomarginata]|nr:hypothetical protein B0H14DRAFT_3866367 [Mycena olivaceomarginata]
MLLSAWVLALHVASAVACSCSSLVIPVDVDVLVPKDPTDVFGGLKSNARSLRRVKDTYDIYGVFCRPDTVTENADVLQLLVHGFTYTSQYWSLPIEEFRNYSYSAFSCDHGLSSLAIDTLGAGLSSRPLNASDVQYPTSAAAITQLARYLKSTSILPGVAPFKKIIGIGHSLGSGLLNFGAIVEGAGYPIDGLILTSSAGVTPNLPPLAILTTARDFNPARWGTLDPAYVTLGIRTLLYPPANTSFSPRMLAFDGFTVDLGTVSTFLQTPQAVTAFKTNYTGPIAKVVGSEDQAICVGSTQCDDVAALTAAERVAYPAARSFEVVVEQGSGHDMNLDFLAQGPFNTFLNFVNQFAGL